MIDAIYASKLYRASKRKDKISAAFNNGKNAELVTQLKSYLDEEYQDLAMPKETTQSNPDVAESQPSDSDTEGGANGSGSSSSDRHSHAGGGSHSSLPSSLDPGFDEDFNPADNLLTVDDADIDTLSNDVSDSGSAKEPVEESVDVYGSTSVESIDVIKGTLNGRDDTKGVTRIQIKDNEMWIYYSDDTNLNNIMTSVIEFLNASGHTDLEFNRLARSDNAIVFVINSVKEEIKPVEAVEEVKK